MKTFLLLVAVGLLGGSCPAAEPEFSDVFASARDGYKSVRIPSVIIPDRWPEVDPPPTTAATRNLGFSTDRLDQS